MKIKYGDKVGMGCVQEQPYMFVQHPQATPAYIYISSSGMPVSTKFKFTATYVGMVVEQYGHVIECISLHVLHSLFVYFVSQCIH